MKKFILCLLLEVLLFGSSYAQSCFSINNALIPCGATCTTLTVTPGTTGLAATTSYSVAPVTYTPFSYNAGTMVAGIGQDDIWSGVVNLPFYFCFFGNSYNQIVVGSNGQISFDVSLAGGLNDRTVTSNSGLPSAPATQSAVRNCILGPFQDLNPGAGGAVRYQTYGTAPCRSFVVSWNNVPLYGCTGATTRQQIVLHEATNIIEINIANKALCTAWNYGSAITGICNSTGTLFYTAPGENGDQFTVPPTQSWRFTPTGAVTPWTYTWRGPAGTIIGTKDTITVCPTAASTVYTVTATNSSCGNFSAVLTSTVTKTGPGTPILGLTTMCVGLTLPLSTAGGNGTWSSSNTNIATIDPVTGQATGVAAGTVVITRLFPGGCTATTTVTVNSAPEISGVSTICKNGTTTLSVSATGGTWINTNPTVATLNTSTGVVRGLSGGTAIILYANTCGIDTVAITVNAVGPITGPTNVCVGSTVRLSSGTAGGGVWSSNSNARATVSPLGIVTGVSAGTVKIAYTIAGGCSDTVSISVSAKPTIVGPLQVCAGSAVVLSSSPAGGGWTSSNTGVATVTPGGAGPQRLTGVSAGTARITYASVGCAVTTSVSVTAVTFAGAGVAGVCVGSTITLSNASAGGTWTSGNTTLATVTSSGTVTGVAAGSPVITYTTNSCSVFGTTVNVNPLPSVTGPVSLCNGTPATLSVSPGGGTWSSSNSAIATVTAANVLTPASAGVVAITYTIPTSCYTTRTVTVLSSVPNIGGIKQVCTTQTVQLSNGATGGTWSSASSSIATVDPASGVVSGVLAGTARITYSLASGCLRTTTVTVFTMPNAGNITGGTSQLCIGDVMTLSTSGSGGTWSSSNTAVSVAGGVVTGMDTGSVTIRYIASNAACSDTGSKTITILKRPDAGTISGPGAFCLGSSIKLNETVTGGVWSSSNTGIASVLSDGGVIGVSTGIDTIMYTVDNGACSEAASYTITVATVPPAGVISGQSVVCVGAIYILHETVTGGVWSSNDTAVATIDGTSGQVHALSAGANLINYTTGAGGVCPGIATFSITVRADAAFIINRVITPLLCHNDSNASIAVTISGGTPPYTYLWSTTDTTAAIHNLSPGTYIVNVRETVTQCMADTSFTITQPDSLYATDSAIHDVCLAGTGAAYVMAYGGTQPYSYAWSNGGAVNHIENLHAGTYTVTVTDFNNCAVQRTPVVTDSLCAVVKVYDAFTPNGDGINDTWIIDGIEAYPGSTVQLFNKWGDKVFEQTNYKNDWSGGALSDGTYYYVIKLNATNMTGGADTFMGSILIKR